MARTVKKRAATSARREELLRVAAKVFAQEGFARTTMRDIAEVADILPGSLYHHFESKEGLVDEILRTYFDDLRELASSITLSTESPDDLVSQLIHRMLDLAGQRREETLIYEHDDPLLTRMFPYIRKTMDLLEETWLEVLRRGVKDGTFSKDLMPQIVYRSALGTMAYFARWYNPKGPLDVQHIADQTTALLLHGMTARPTTSR